MQTSHTPDTKLTDQTKRSIPPFLRIITVIVVAFLVVVVGFIILIILAGMIGTQRSKGIINRNMQYIQAPIGCTEATSEDTNGGIDTQYTRSIIYKCTNLTAGDGYKQINALFATNGFKAGGTSDLASYKGSFGTILQSNKDIKVSITLITSSDSSGTLPDGVDVRTIGNVQLPLTELRYDID